MSPGGTTLFYNLYLYKKFFTFQNMSYGATLAWVLFLIILFITLVLFGASRRWVYYAGETLKMAAADARRRAAVPVVGVAESPGSGGACGAPAGGRSS